MNYKDEIKHTVSKSIESFFLNKKVTVSHPLDLIFPKERRIRSLIGGLETSLGTKVWEPLAKMFAQNNGFEVLDEKELNASVLRIPEDVMHKLSDFENKKLNNPALPHSLYKKEIADFISMKNIKPNERRKMPKGEGVDVWLKKDGQELLIDIKTVQLNAGGGPKFNKNLLKRVEELELSVRSMNCLKNDNIIYIGDLVQKTEPEMLRTPNFGRKSLNEIKEVLSTMSLYLGMEIPNWPPDNIAEMSKKLEENNY